jgi:16S rRNA (cytidine1402-2'-O)-methyltransferase
VVATPLGNLEDISLRAKRALESADVIAAEDTRRTGRLLQRLGIPRKIILSYYAPHEERKAEAILAHLRAGETVALVTDGGTPGVSDPGAVLVHAAHRDGIRVEPIPGPSAVSLALSVSSAGGERFVFEGFLPPRQAARRRRLQELKAETRTIVLYEAPHRIAACVADLAEILGGERRATVVREATKVFEEIREDRLASLQERFAGGAKGEIVLVVEGTRETPTRPSVEIEALIDFALCAGLSPSRAARDLARLTGLSRNRLTRMIRERHERG